LPIWDEARRKGDLSLVCGIYSPQRPDLASAELLNTMLAASTHRCRDGVRTFVDPSAGIALGYGYSATFGEDPETPSWSVGDNIVAAVDGQFFNGAKAEDRVPAGGPHVSALKDRYQADEASFPSGLDGVFSFVLWDRDASRLYISLDPAAHRYIYYHWDEVKHLLVFSSELDGVLAHPEVPRLLNDDAVMAYMALGLVPPPMSFVQGVSKLRAAECRVFDSSRVETRRYLRVEIEQGPDDEEYWLPLVRQGLLDALQRTVASAPVVGVHFSGGLDSSNVLAGLKVLGKPRVEAFTLAYEGHPGGEELQWAGGVARSLGVTHHVVRVDAEAQVTPDVVGTALNHLDEPVFTALRSFNEVFMSRATLGRGIDSILNGATPGFGLGRLRRMKERANYRTVEELFLGYLERYHFSPEHIVHATGREPDPELLHRLSYANEELCVGLDELPRLILSTRLGANSLRGTLFYEQIPLALGQEQRSPFSDTRLLILQVSVPPRLCGIESAAYNKRLWKRVFADILPEGFDRQPAHGYPAAPKPAWLKAMLIPRLRVLEEDGILRAGYLEWLATKLDKGRRGEFEAWTWFWFAWWYVRTIRQEDPLAGMPV
jgi:asparagine synthetase B (glutamine-hydrolysing)